MEWQMQLLRACYLTGNVVILTGFSISFSVHHGQPPLGGSEVNGRIPIVLIDLAPLDDGTVEFDPVDTLQHARRSFSDSNHFDIRGYLPDGRILAGELEDAPQHLINFTRDNLPIWLRII
ncbi:MAG TPA: hypothetical protein VJW55_08500 [Candidatus Angelobacter sp.]|nr:hypothetical protein [Candidatus Angelobacter sp.]